MTVVAGFVAVALSWPVLGSVTSPQAPPTKEPTPLTAGAAIEREMKEGEEHRYTIELREGDYLQVVVEQQGVDVWETLTGPDGRTILKVYGHVADLGPDPIALVAPAAGTYDLALFAHESTTPPSRYVLRLEAVRDPTETDHLRVKAVSAMAEAERLRLEPPRDARAELLREREAFAAWQALGDRRMQMWSLLSSGYIDRVFLDQFKDAAQDFALALSLARELGDAVCEAKVLYNLGHTEWRLAQFDEGQRLFEEAVALHRASGRRDKEAYVLMALGRLLTVAGDLQPALDRLNQALEIHRSLGTFARQVDTQAILRLNIGDVYVGLGEYELALDQYHLAVPAQGDADKEFSASVLAARGAAYFGLGDLARARAMYAQTLEIYRHLENRVLEAEVSLLLGDVYGEEGDLDAARGIFSSALEVLRSRGDPVGESKALGRLGEVQRRIGDHPAARSAFERALAVAPAEGVLLSICPEQGLARLSADLGDLETAQKHAERALAGAESFRASVASHRTRAATLATQQSLYELLVDLHMRQHERQPSAGHDAAALEVAERARARGLLELLTEGRIDLRADGDPGLLAEERSLRQRLRARAETQEEALARRRPEEAEDLGREIDDLTARLAEVQGRIRRASPRYAALTQPEPLKLAGIRAQVLDPETQLLQYALGETRSYLWILSAERLESFRLAPRAEIERAARRAHELTSRPAGATGAEDQAAAFQDLARLILAPASSALTGKRLLVVAPGALQYVPFAALPLPDGSLALSRYEVVSVPSASAVATLRGAARRRTDGGKVAAVFADPVFEASDPRLAAARGRSKPVVVATASTDAAPPDPLERALRGVSGTGRAGGLTRLPFSRQEAEVIASLAAGKQPWKATGFEANRESATSPRLADYRIVHFATYGVLNTRQPDLSGVVLSLFDEQGGRQDGFLRLHDVYNLRLGADLVVLSGCQTALGQELRGEGLVGLTRGFMYAGARSVVASLWQVDDESTAELMKRFYRAMLKEGRRPADALRAAQLEMSRDRRWSAPFYWAGFVLQGEWR